MEGLPVKGQGEAPVRIVVGGRLVVRRLVGDERVVATRGLTDMRGLATAGRGVSAGADRLSSCERRCPPVGLLLHSSVVDAVPHVGLIITPSEEWPRAHDTSDVRSLHTV
jgi:hypothetical protein